MLIYAFTILFRNENKLSYLKTNLNKKQTEIWTVSPIHSFSDELQNSASSVLIWPVSINHAFSFLIH
jgi:hypothetical protein